MKLPVQFLRQRRDIADQGAPPQPAFSLQQQEDFCDFCASNPDDPNCQKFQQFCSQLSASLAAATSSSPPSASNTSEAQTSVSGSDTPGIISSTSADPTTPLATQPVVISTAVESSASNLFSETSGALTTPPSLSATLTSSLSISSPSSGAVIPPARNLAAAHPDFTGPIVGIIVGVVALVLLLGAFLRLRKCRRLQQIGPSQEFMWTTTSAPGSIGRSPSRLNLNTTAEPEMASVGSGVTSRSASPYAQSQTQSYESPMAGTGLGPPPLHAVGFSEVRHANPFGNNNPRSAYDGSIPYPSSTFLGSNSYPNSTISGSNLYPNSTVSGSNSFLTSSISSGNSYIGPPGTPYSNSDQSRSNNPYINRSAPATNPFTNPTPNPFATPYGTPTSSREHLPGPALDSELF